MIHLLLIGGGGFAGAVVRYLVDRRIAAFAGANFPWGTMVVNLTGSFAVGVLFALLVERAALPANLRGPLMIGFLGAYTTFSTLTVESARMMEEGAWLYAALNLGGSVLLGMIAVFAGMAIGRLI